MGLIKIYKGEAVAWIGESAPVPEGWGLDVNKAPVMPDEPLPDEPVNPPKKPGRPRRK